MRRKFQIDDQLGRRTKSLRHLHDLEAFDELKAYVEKHELYPDALDFYRYRSPQLGEIMKLYAGFLERKSRFGEAGIGMTFVICLRTLLINTVHEYLSDYHSASEAYRAAHLWREALSCAVLASIPPPQLISMATSLVEGLTEAKEYRDAATICLDYLSATEDAVRLLCKGFFFSEAIRVLSIRRQPELLESLVDPGLIEGSATMTELLAECRGQLRAQIPRIKELREKKAEDPGESLSFWGFLPLAELFS